MLEQNEEAMTWYIERGFEKLQICFNIIGNHSILAVHNIIADAKFFSVIVSKQI